MQQVLQQTINTHNMLQIGDSVVVALSGGADSVTLLHIMQKLQVELGISQILAVHVNHGLRGQDATNDEIFVKELCSNMDIPLQVFHANVLEYAQENALSIEEAGRKLRYQYLYKACNNMPNVKIATGHHQNDNAETVVMNLARGTGLRGLCGIPYTNGNIIRPLLDISQAQINAYIVANGLRHAFDETNLSSEYTRNRVRQHLLPAIEKAVNPSAAKTIAQNTVWLRAEDEYMEEVARQAFAECSQTLYNLHIPTLLSHHIAIARRVIRLALDFLHSQNQACENASSFPSIFAHFASYAKSPIPTQQDITGQHIQSVLDLAQNKSGKQVHLPRLIVRKEYELLVFDTEYKMRKAAPFPAYHLHIPSTTFISELGVTITVDSSPPSDNKKSQLLVCTKTFDYGKVNGELLLRTRKPGDKISMSGTPPFTKKLQDYFTDTKTPLHMRDTIPILALGSDVLWILDAKSPVSDKYSISLTNFEALWVSLWRDDHAS